mgnify:CR=1 FL=1
MGEIKITLESLYDLLRSEKKREDLVKKLIGDSAALDTLTLLGKKLLAYPIKKQTEGVYLLATITGEAVKVGDIQKRSSQMAEVLRYLLIGK